MRGAITAANWLRRLRDQGGHTREYAPVLDDLYRRTLGRPVDPAGRRHYGAALRAGATRGGIILDLLHSEEYLQLAADRVNPIAGETDEEFVHRAYRTLLQREPDPGGLAHHLSLLRDGGTRQDVTLRLAGSDEHTNRVASEVFGLADLRAVRPDAFRDVTTAGGEDLTVFHCNEPRDWDWLEHEILTNGYYDKPGIWSLSVDQDKRVMAELLTSLSAGPVLEIGCASGAVLQCLAEHGVDAEGVDISRSAASRAHRSVRQKIHIGDLLDLQLPGRYDLIYGLDIFEHFNPNRLHRYLARLAELVTPTGYVFANIPAFGPDPEFGTVFELYVDSWRDDAAHGRPFADLQVDSDGYPVHGHLIWADTQWWQVQFAAHGFSRVPQIERALHRIYDGYMKQAGPARAAYYVFSLAPQPARVAESIDRIEELRQHGLLASSR